MANRIDRRTALAGIGATMVAAAGTGASAAEAAPPLPERLRAAGVGDKPFTLIVKLTAKADAGPKLIEAVAKATAPTRKESGCVAYDLQQDLEHPEQFLLYERWKNVAALETHLAQDYIKELLASFGSLVAKAEVDIMKPAT